MDFKHETLIQTVYLNWVPFKTVKLNWWGEVIDFKIDNMVGLGSFYKGFETWNSNLEVHFLKTKDEQYTYMEWF